VAIPLGIGLALANITSHVADKTVVFWAVVGGVVAGAWLARELALKVRVVHSDRIGEAPAGSGDTP
jgi:hypothetical protein